jgi:hypothetical protein
MPPTGDFASSSGRTAEVAGQREERDWQKRGSLGSALAARRWVVIAAPLLAGLFAVGGSIADPVAGEDGRELVAAYAEDPGRVQVKSVAYHFSYALWLPVVFGLVGLVRWRGGWLANAAAGLGILGLTTMPGLIIVDFYDSTLGSAVGVEEAVRLGDQVGEMWGLGVIAGTGTIGFVLSLPVALVAAWRAGLVRWWAPAAVLIGLAVFAVSVATLPGTIAMALGFAVLSLALWRIDPTAWVPGSARTAV